MKEIDMFLKGNFLSYNYNDYETLYGLAKIYYNKRFILLYSGNITQLNTYDSKLSFEGMFDTEKELLYIASDYFNILSKESDFEKILINKVIDEISNGLIETYNNYIYENEKSLKAEALDSFNKFYSDERNKNTLQEEAEDFYKHCTPIDFKPKFEIERRIGFGELCEYLTDKEGSLNTWCLEKLNTDKMQRISSSYSDGLDVTVTLREYIGFRLLRQDEIKKLVKEIEEDKNPKSKQLKKLRSIIEFTNNYADVKNVFLGLKYKNKSLEVQCPVEQLRRLNISDWYLPVKDRKPFNELFYDLKWSGDIEKILSIVYIKYRGRIIYEDKDES